MAAQCGPRLRLLPGRPAAAPGLPRALDKEEVSVVLVGHIWDLTSPSLCFQAESSGPDEGGKPGGRGRRQRPQQLQWRPGWSHLGSGLQLQHHGAAQSAQQGEQQESDRQTGN